MATLSDLRLSKNMKYTALYWAMRFFEYEPNIFVKDYKIGTKIEIYADEQQVYINEQLSFELNTHESFVKLECIDRLLSLGYFLNDVHMDNDLFRFKGYNIQFIVWDKSFSQKQANDKDVQYKSRLVSGVLEYQSKIYDSGEWFDYGLFEEKNKEISLRKKDVVHYDSPNFIFDENRIMRYIGKEKVVVVPNGVEEIESSAFWDNQYIEEVVLPSTLKNMGGDTFYYCKNLRKINIPASVISMGNNPFAGCPLITIQNDSPNFILEGGVLYSADKQTLIYCSIRGDETEYVIPEGVKIIGKHAFYLCDRFEKITLPKSLQKMENNPFSGCSKLTLINHSKAYHIQDDVIYNGFRTAVIGTLNKIKSKRLEILSGVKSINRNSFWNCKGIETIVFPESLEDIGYNPFVECSNIHFESKSSHFKVVNGVLYNKDCSKIICYPAWKASGVVNIPDSVITLERGAFSGCKDMTEINLHNVNIINKSCFTNCVSLEHVYCSDLITYIGEWAFAYCKNLHFVSVRSDAIIDNNAFSNCNPNIEYRKGLSNYLFESDNVFTLKSMQSFYHDKIDSILIDPPYNSHIDYIGYQDGDYPDYIEFIRVRLKLAYTLLSDKGFLVINIDDGERDRLKELCISIFGIGLVKVYQWKKKHEFFDTNRVVLNPNKIQTDYEYIIVCRKSSNAVLGKLMQPYIENGILKEKESNVPEVFDCFGTTSSAKDEIKSLFGKREYFSTPKPLKLMKELIRATTSCDSLILDFFAGSGTTGHACLELNAEDRGSRKFILVSNKESDICETVTDKRLQITSDRFNEKYVFMK